MQIFVFKDAESVAAAASMVFAAQLYQKPDSVLGLATGSTPIPTYQALIDFARKGLVDFSRARTFNLDEYVGLSPNHPYAYRRFMDDQLFRHIPIDSRNTHVPSGLGNPEDNARAYDRLIEAAGGIDLQLLGIGLNGHIGFNEPAEDYTWGTPWWSSPSPRWRPTPAGLTTRPQCPARPSAWASAASWRQSACCSSPPAGTRRRRWPARRWARCRRTAPRPSCASTPTPS